jgi:transmembrane sensor
VNIFEIISTVLNGNPSNEEKALFDKWLKESESNRKTFEYISQIRGQRSSEVKWDKEKIWNITQNKIKESKFKKTITLWRAIAASVAALFLMSAILFLSDYSKPGEVASVITSTPKGITSKVELSDGSIVYLNAGSELRFPSTFNGENRKVTLLGEAYFEVAKNKEMPFIVEASGINIKVLGTKFNVQSYLDNSQITTTLIEGSIGLQDSTRKQKHKEVLLKPGHKAIFNKKTKKLQVTQVADASLYISWIDRSYFFEDEPFMSIIKKLERGFNVNINVNVEKLKNENTPEHLITMRA